MKKLKHFLLKTFGVYKWRRSRWAAALRSGDYTQGYSSLRFQDDGWCCLGVACDVFHKVTGCGQWLNLGSRRFRFVAGDDWDMSTMPMEVAEWYGYDTPNPYLEGVPATQHNDFYKRTFNEIAKLITG